MRFLSTVFLLLAATASAQGWALHPAVGPAARQAPGMAYDVGRAQTVLYGGVLSSTVAFADTWLFDGATWMQATPVTTPPPLAFPAMCYELTRGVTVMFGGALGSLSNPIAETWEWNGTNWTQRLPTLAPSGRYGAALAHDPVRGVTVLFGGQDVSGAQADTWEWNGASWSQVVTPTTPPVRQNHRMVYDPGRGTVVMFGGQVGFTLLGDTWEFDGTDWRTIQSDRSPAARPGMGMAYDPGRGAIVLFAGRTPQPTNDTWELRLGQWHEFRLLTPPANRTNIGMCFDLQRGRMVVFGGSGGHVDTWEFGGVAPSFASYGVGCPGSAGTPTLTPTVLPGLGTTFGLQLSNVPASGFTMLAASLGADHSAVPGTACTLLLAQPIVAYGAFAQGNVASYAVSIPNSPVFAGLAVHYQGVALDAVNALGITGSNAGRAVVN